MKIQNKIKQILIGMAINGDLDQADMTELDPHVFDSALTTSNLISELQDRGHNTSQIWCHEDVERSLFSINENLPEGEKIVLSESDMDIVLENALERDSLFEIINENIDYEIRDILIN